VAPQEYAERMMADGNLPALVAEVRRSKALAHLLETATVTDASGRPVDLSALRRPTSPDEADEADDTGTTGAGATDTPDLPGASGEPVLAAETTGSGESTPS
jgi:trigger factor